MQFSTALVTLVATLFAGEAMGAALIATDDYYACNCPNNCSHKSGSSCKYYAGVSDTSPIVSGKCASYQGQLVCIVT